MVLEPDIPVTATDGSLFERALVPLAESAIVHAVGRQVMVQHVGDPAADDLFVGLRGHVK